MVIEYKTTTQLNAETLQDLARQAVVSNLNAGARARVLHEIMNIRLGESYDTLRFNNAMIFLTSSSGWFLDLVGRVAGIPRRAASTAVVEREDENFKFYVISGVLKDKVPSGVIPNGTLIQNATGSIQFQMTVDAPFSDTDTSVYVSAAAVGPGSDYRAGRNILQSHSLGSPDVLFTNEKEILTGEDRETDDNYRFRIANSRAAKESANLTAVRLAMLPVPGVADVVIREFPGLMEALIIPSGNIVSKSTVRACQFLGNREKAGGIRLTALSPRMLPFELFLHLRLTSTTPSTQREEVKNHVRADIFDYMDDIRMGGTLVIKQLESRIQNSDGRVLDHRLVCLSINRRPHLLRNFPLRDDELFVPDNESENPVAIAVV